MAGSPPEIESTDFAALGLGELAQFLDQGMQDWGDANAAVHSGTTGPDGQIHEHHVKARGPMPLKVDALSRALSDQAGLAGFSVMPRDD